MVRTARNLGQDAESLATSDVPDPKQRGLEFFQRISALCADPNNSSQDSARLATSNFRPGPIVEVTDTFLT
jgi:hypothetical protein